MTNDRATNQLIVWFVGICLVICICCISVLSVKAVPIPNTLENAAIAFGTGLLAILKTSGGDTRALSRATDPGQGEPTPPVEQGDPDAH